MAAATVIHFGGDDVQRVKALKHAGYEVRKSDGIDALRHDLERDDAVLAVMVTEGERGTTEQVAAVVRKYSGAPLILFRRSDAALDQRRFDRVYSPAVPAANWLFDTAVLVEQSRALREASERLRVRTQRLGRESKAAVRASQRQRERARLQRQAANSGSWTKPRKAEDGWV